MQAVGYGNHGAFDEVGGGALHGGVDGGALGAGAGVGVFGADVGQVEAAAEQGFYVALGGGFFFGALHVFGHAGVAGEVAVDKVFGGQIVDAQRFGQAVLTHAVDQAEVDGFGVAALLGADVFRRDAEHFGGGAAVHVFAVLEGGNQGFVA